MIFLILFQIVVSQLLYQSNYQDEIESLTAIRDLQSESQCIKFLKLPQFQDQIIHRELLLRSFRNKWFKCSIQVIKYFNSKEVDLYETFQTLKQQKNLNESAFEQLIQYLPEHSPILNIIEPCYLWAQNMTHIFLKIKFSSKLDVPGAQQINRLSINITTPSIYIEGYSFELLTRYILRIQTYRFLNPNFYSYKIVELGQLVIEVLKSPSPYFWKNIHSNVMYNPPNQYIWWDMYYQYRTQLEVAFGLLEDNENKREENERNQLKEELKIRQSKQQLKKIKNENQELYKQLYCRNCIPLDGDEWSSWII